MKSEDELAEERIDKRVMKFLTTWGTSERTLVKDTNLKRGKLRRSLRRLIAADKVGIKRGGCRLVSYVNRYYLLKEVEN